MEAIKVLEIVQREMKAIGARWRLDWSDFDGRTLRCQLDSLSEFADEALRSDIDIDYTDASEALERQRER